MRRGGTLMTAHGHRQKDGKGIARRFSGAPVTSSPFYFTTFGGQLFLSSFLTLFTRRNVHPHQIVHFCSFGRASCGRSLTAGSNRGHDDWMCAMGLLRPFSSIEKASAPMEKSAPFAVEKPAGGAFAERLAAPAISRSAKTFWQDCCTDKEKTLSLPLK